MSAGSKGDLTKDVEQVYTTYAYMSKQRQDWLRASARGWPGRVRDVHACLELQQA